jgi:hypothetical protein
MGFTVPWNSILNESRVTGGEPENAWECSESCALHVSPARLSLLRKLKEDTMNDESSSSVRVTDGRLILSTLSRDFVRS